MTRESSENSQQGGIDLGTSNKCQSSNFLQTRLDSPRGRRRSVSPCLVDLSNLIFRERCYTMPLIRNWNIKDGSHTEFGNTQVLFEVFLG